MFRTLKDRRGVLVELFLLDSKFVILRVKLLSFAAFTAA